MVAYLVGVLFFAIGIAVFVFQNTALVSVRFINWISPEVSLAVVALVAACAGAVIAFLLDSIRYFKVAKKVKELMNNNRRLEKELTNQKKELAARRDNRKSAAEPQPANLNQPAQPPE